MSVYQRDENARPDSEFEPGEIAHLVVGNRGRLLDPRRTPVSVADVRLETGTFVARIEGFEDRGALWEVEFENVSHYQFALGSSRAAPEDTARFREAIDRLNRALTVPCDPPARAETIRRLAREREAAERWMGERSRFFAERGELPPPDRREGDPRLYDDLRRFMASRGLSDLEAGFARRFVSNPCSGDLVKGHRIVIAELGLVSYQGKVARDPAIFEGSWSKERRADHVLSRMGFVFAMLVRAGLERVPLYRGISTEGPLERPDNRTFVSATFSPEVARSHFESGTPEATRVLLRQTVPAERVFMTYLETAPMNQQFKEAEAVLLYDPDNLAF